MEIAFRIVQQHQRARPVLNDLPRERRPDRAPRSSQQDTTLGEGMGHKWQARVAAFARQRFGKADKKWFRGLDSNQDSRLQRPMCYQLHHPGMVWTTLPVYLRARG